MRAIHKNSEADKSIIGIPKHLNVRKTALLDAPLIVGLFRPTLFLPNIPISESDMNYILMHELTHYKRGDILYKWFAMIISSIHWFNPFVYIVSRQIDTECEVSCDFSVTSNLSDNEKNNYMSMILDLVANSKSGLRPLTTQMASGKKELKRRFTMIKKSIKVNKKAAIISGILAIVILATAIFASGIIRGNLFKSYNNSTISLNIDEIDGNNFNMLFVGVDKGGRADTIMLFEVEKDSMKCVSIPRNTLMENNRISDIFAKENGNQAIIDAVKKNLNVPIHYYAEMNLSAVKEIIDSVGGIEFDVPMDMNYDDPYQDLHINLKKGVQTLSGEDVCGLLQFRRGYTEGDLSRIQLHGQFLNEFIKQKLNKENIDKASDILQIVSENIKTNYSISNFKQDIKIVDSIGNITFETVPGKISVYENMPVYELE